MTFPLLLWVMGLFAGISFGFSLANFFIAWVDARERARVQKQLIEVSGPELNQTGRWLPVLCSSADHLNAFWTTKGYEATGILFITNEATTFFYPDLFKTSQTVQFKLGEAKLTWFGAKLWPKGPAHWFVIEQAGKKHYFMVDVGFSTIFASRRQTQELYNRLSPLFA
jgi:hypothetical protein